MTLENLMLSLAVGLSAGILVGFVTARTRQARAKAKGKDQQKLAAFNSRLIALLSKSIYAVLGVGLVWTLYFMVIGLVDKRQTEYAANAATLIVSVVTLFSIMIAYYEFMRRDK